MGLNYISIIERKSKALQNLIQTFYDVSRLEANDYKMNMQVIDIHKELMEHMLLYYNDFEKRNLNVNIDMIDECVNIEGDIKSIERIFNNLIQNAIKYSKSSLEVKLNKNKEYVNITFINDTENLEEKDVDNLFNRFYMKDESRHNHSSGLGLTVTKLLIECMNGEIDAFIKDNYIYFNLKFKTIK